MVRLGQHRRWQRLLRVAAIALLPVLIAMGVLVWSLAQGANFLVGGGSTSVVPLMNDFLSFYRTADKGHKTLLYNAIGSAAALTGIVNGAYQFGFLSKTVDDAQAQQLFAEDKIYRFVVARDPVMLIYNFAGAGQITGSDRVVFDSGKHGGNSGKHIIFGAQHAKGSGITRTLSEVMGKFYFQHQS